MSMKMTIRDIKDDLEVYSQMYHAINKKNEYEYKKDEYKKTIGLEIHAQIDTNTKLFSRAIVDEKAEPNENVNLLDAGMPGALPVPNKEAILLALKSSLALNMKINQISIFDRKHYFYQDSPLGYQITQFYQPIGLEGFIECSFGKIRINRLHIESDAGKSLYKDNHTYIDLNRAGVPLMEIVTEPDFENEDQVIEFLKELRLILMAVKTSKCDMEAGNFRCDVNISISKEGEPLGTRVEIKNLNSYSTIKKAIQYEYKKQVETLKEGNLIKQETKLFDPTLLVTKAIRDKDDFWGYSYFPDPDLLPVFLEEETIEEYRKNLPVLPAEIRNNLQKLNIAKEQSYVLTESMDRINFFEKLMQLLPENLIIKASNWVCSELIGKLARLNIDFEDFLKENRSHFIGEFAKIIKLCELNEITRSNAKSLLDFLIENDQNLDEIIEKNGYLNKEEIDIDSLILNLLNNSPDEVAKFKAGKIAIVMYFVGMLMKETKGKLNPDLLKNRITELLKGF